jgi:hypothetical protein
MQDFINNQFAVGIGIEDEPQMERDPILNWRYGAVIITSDNSTVISKFKRISDKVLSYEDPKITSEIYLSWAKE